MNTPKPGPFKPANQAPKPESKKSEKRPYVQKPHLTDKPFRNNEGLQKLQAELRRREGRRPMNPKAKRQR